MAEKFLQSIKRAIDINDAFAVYDLIDQSDASTLTEALIHSIYCGRYEICRLLTHSNADFGCSINQNGLSFRDRSTPFIDLIRRHYFDVAEEIERRGYHFTFSPEIEPIILYDMLHIADQEWKTKILNNPSFSLISIENFQKLILYACANNDIDLLKILIQRISSISYQDQEGNTPLHFATINASVDAFKMLITLDINPFLKNKEGQTPLHLLCGDYHYWLPCSLLMLEIHSQYLDAVMTSLIKEGEMDPFRNLNFEELMEICDNKNTTQKMTIAKSKIEEDFERYFKKKSYHEQEKDRFRILSDFPNLSTLVNLADNEGNTSLHLAINEYRDQNFVEILLNHGANPNMLNNQNKSPLHLVSLPWQVDILIEHGAKLNLLDNANQTPLECAIKNPYFQRFDVFFARNEKPLIYEEHIEDVLNYCIKSRILSPILIKYLLAFIIPENHRKIFSNLLQLACEENCGWLIEILLSKGVDVNLQDVNGDSLLHLLLNEKFSAKTDCIGILLNYGLNVNIKNNNGYSPLEYVLESQLSIQVKFNIAKALLEHGVNIDIKNSMNQNILHMLTEKTETIPLLSMVLNKIDPSSINERDFFGKTPLHYILAQIYAVNPLSNQELFDVVSNLLDHSADPNISDLEELTPIHYLFANPSKDIQINNFINLFYENNFNFNIRDGHGRNFIHYAAWYNRCETVEKLVSLGLSLYEKDNYKKTPFDYFWEYHHGIGSRNFYHTDQFCEAFQNLLPEKCNTQYIDPISKESILIKAVRSHENSHLRQLLKIPADINHTDILDMNALDWACIEDNLKSFEILISEGAKKRLFNSNNDSFLHFAAFGSYFDYFIKELVPLYLNVDIADNYGMTPFAVALLSGNRYICTFLLKLGSRINPSFNPSNTLSVNDSIILNPNYYPLLTYETILNICNMRRQILRANASNLLSFIAENGFVGSLFELKEILNDYEVKPFCKDFDINYRDELGWTAMHWAAFWGNKEVMDFLISMGANKDILTLGGETPDEMYKYFIRYM